MIKESQPVLQSYCSLSSTISTTSSWALSIVIVVVPYWPFLSPSGMLFKWMLLLTMPWFKLMLECNLLIVHQWLIKKRFHNEVSIKMYGHVANQIDRQYLRIYSIILLGFFCGFHSLGDPSIDSDMLRALFILHFKWLVED